MAVNAPGTHQALADGQSGHVRCRPCRSGRPPAVGRIREIRARLAPDA